MICAAVRMPKADCGHAPEGRARLARIRLQEARHDHRRIRTLYCGRALIVQNPATVTVHVFNQY
jgi:hypothetical protein